MDWAHDLAESLRNALLQLDWLAAWAPTMEATPDWALLAAGPTAAVLTWLLARLFSGGRPKPSKARKQNAEPQAGDLGHAPAAKQAPTALESAQAATQSPIISEPIPPATASPAAATPTNASGDLETSGASASITPTPIQDAPPEVAGATDPTHNDADAQMLVMLATQKLHEGNKQEAIGFYEKAVEKDPKHSHAWCQLGGLYGQTARYDASQQAFQRALDTASNAGEEGVALWGLALAAVDRKDLETAEVFFDRAATRLEGVSDEAATLVRSARNAAALKQARSAPEAEPAFERALQLAREHEMPEEEAQCLQGLIQIARNQRQPAKLERLVPEALALQTRLGLKHDQAVSLSLLRGLAGQKRDNASARAYAHQALALLRELGDKKLEATELYWLGVLERDDHDPSAYATFEQCLHIAEAEDMTRVTIDALNKLADFDYRADRFESAKRRASRAAELATAANDAQAEAIALRTLGCVAEDEGDDDAKITHWRNARSRAIAAKDQQLISNLDDLLGGG